MLEHYAITKFTVFIGVGYDFLQCCLASFQFVTVTAHLRVLRFQTLTGPSIILKCGNIFPLCVHINVHVRTYIFLINISQEAGSYPLIQINLYKINFKEEVIPET